MPLARLLSHLALDRHTGSVVDPMCGDGNLLVATAAAAEECGLTLTRLDGIELDSRMARRCRERLSIVASQHSRCEVSIGEGNAFELVMRGKLRLHSYDLVIANPPYVRYQALSRDCVSTRSPSARQIREQLAQICNAIADDFWTALANGYSGFADLSVPSWMLSAALVAPGGMLALVVPATWRSREYADVLRYLMVRAFNIETIVEDTQPGWFSDALVRTHLVIARRRTETQPLGMRERPTRHVKWLTIAPDAATAESIVGAVFPTATPERDLLDWLNGRSTGEFGGISLRSTPASRDLDWLQSHASRRKWYIAVEGQLHPAETPASSGTVPDVLAEAIGLHETSFSSLGELPGLSIGQGLRTGCNGFFYVESRGPGRQHESELFESALFPDEVFEAPSSVLRPVLRRQSELSAYIGGGALSGRLLDLRGWVLDEDTENLSYDDMRHLRLLPPSLAAYVRSSAEKRLAEDDESTRIPLLSAVRTNVRRPKAAESPRFWYTIPDFAPRHTPHLFVARVSNNSPLVYRNRSEQFLIDANFSTLVVGSLQWSASAILAYLRSTWSQTCMELIGTNMGGGALKLEAAQLRKLPMPPLTVAETARLDELASLGMEDAAITEADRIILKALLNTNDAVEPALHRLRELLHQLRLHRRQH